MSEAVSSMPSLEEKNVRIAGRTLKLSGLVNDTYFSSINDNFEDVFYEFASKYLSPDSTAIDVGANIGITSLILDRVLCNGRIIAFEPSPTVFPILEKNIGLIESENVTLHNLAVGAKEGAMKFRDESAYGYIVRDDSMGNKSKGFPTVKITKLDDFIINSNLNRVDFVKIDVEGFEYDVLCGMENIIKQFNPLVYFEFNSWTLIALRNMNPRKLLDFVLSKFKYVYYFDSSNELTLLNDNNSIYFLKENILRHGCVDNIVATNDLTRLELSCQHIKSKIGLYLSERDQALAERDKAVRERDQALGERDRAVGEKDQALAERDALLCSRSWRLTKPLRKFQQLIKP